MSKKRDYTRFSKGPAESIETVETVVADVTEPVETIVDDMPVVEVAQESVVYEVKAKESTCVNGIVTGCSKLNVRERPVSDADILGVITANTELVINEEESTRNFYKICTPAGLEGYCVKDYVTIMP